jgi:hypothetical protein
MMGKWKLRIGYWNTCIESELICLPFELLIKGYAVRNSLIKFIFDSVEWLIITPYPPSR